MRVFVPTRRQFVAHLGAASRLAHAQSREALPESMAGDRPLRRAKSPQDTNRRWRGGIR